MNFLGAQVQNELDIPFTYIHIFSALSDSLVKNVSAQLERVRQMVTSSMWCGQLCNFVLNPISLRFSILDFLLSYDVTRSQSNISTRFFTLRTNAGT